MTPSKRRRIGREDFDPGVDPDDVNPYLNQWKHCWGAEWNAVHWRDGWDEARAAYDVEQEDQSEQYWVMATFIDGSEEHIGEVIFDSSNPPTELEIDGITYIPQL